MSPSIATVFCGFRNRSRQRNGKAKQNKTKQKPKQRNIRDSPIWIEKVMQDMWEVDTEKRVFYMVGMDKVQNIYNCKFKFNCIFKDYNKFNCKINLKASWCKT